MKKNKVKWFEMLSELAVTEGAENVEGTEAVETTQTESEGISTQEAEPTTTSGIEIDGEVYTPEQLKEFRQGYLRQSDYTRKTQEIAQMRKEANDAIELYNYLKDNPHIAQRLAEAEEPAVQQRAQEIVADPMIKELSLKIHTMEIDNQLNAIKTQDPNFDEIRVLEIALENDIGIDKAYNIWRGENFDSILKKELESYGKNVVEKLQSNAASTSTMMSPNDSPANNTHGLSEIELDMCKKLDMTPAEYAKYKTYKR